MWEIVLITLLTGVHGPVKKILSIYKQSSSIHPYTYSKQAYWLLDITSEKVITTANNNDWQYTITWLGFADNDKKLWFQLPTLIVLFIYICVCVYFHFSLIHTQMDKGCVLQ